MSDSEDSTTPLKDVIKSGIDQIKEGLTDDSRIDGIITLRLSTVIEKGRDRGVDLKVLNLGSDASTTHTQEWNIPIRILTDTGLTLEKAMKAEFEARIANAETDRKIAEERTANIGKPRVRATSSRSGGGVH